MVEDKSFEDDGEMAAAVRELAAETAAHTVSHPPPEELFDYQERRLGDEAAERVRDHLATCPRCSRLVLDQASFPELEAAAGSRTFSADAVARSWETFRRRLDREGIRLPPAETRPRPRPPLRFDLRGLLPAAAAALLLVSVGLSFWVRSLYERLEERSRPAAHVFLVDLVPAGGQTVRDRDPEAVVEVPEWADRMVFILNLFSVRSHRSYQVEILPAAGRDGDPLWREEGLQPTPDRNFVVQVPREFLPAGSYRVELFGVDGEERTRVAEYPLTLHYE
jgi:hypothetical protein